MSDELRTALRELGERMPPARLPGDPWAAGRRQRRRVRWRTAGAALVAVLACALGVPAGLGAPGPWATPAAAPDGVPERIGLPYMWQASVEQDPPGPASLLFSGGGLGLRGIDGLDHEGKVAVLGRDGRYRMLLYGGRESVAGEEVLLSPDGRYVADSFTDGWVGVTDLTDGSRRVFTGWAGSTCCGTPVAWAPDGSALLVLHHAERTGQDAENDGPWPSRLVLLELASGATRDLGPSLGDPWSVRTGSLAAFSPDGSRIVASAGDELVMLDRNGESSWSRQLGPDRRLAGIGAFTPDGSAVAVFHLDGCLSRCDADQRAARTWRVGYVDAATGRDGAGPALPPVRGQALRALGWRGGTDLVAVRYEPEPGTSTTDLPDWNDTGYWETGHVQLVALRPDGHVETLLDPPGPVWAMDVARDLLVAGRFGAPATDPRPFPARPVILLVAVPPALLVAAVLGSVLLWRRHRRWLRTMRPAPPGR
ncbi:WD40 repeat domain-containing protein [Micromonospora sp. URMC 107]|uniref:WD40 repeat domain-containing protein n=1 Tax=Micromonospora sp. URMC 107 TaxID=3423418 RepID=UPI003F1AD50F